MKQRLQSNSRDPRWTPTRIIDAGRHCPNGAGTLMACMDMFMNVTFAGQHSVPLQILSMHMALQDADEGAEDGFGGVLKPRKSSRAQQEESEEDEGAGKEGEGAVVNGIKKKGVKKVGGLCYFTVLPVSVSAIMVLDSNIIVSLQRL